MCAKWLLVHAWLWLCPAQAAGGLHSNWRTQKEKWRPKICMDEKRISMHTLCLYLILLLRIWNGLMNWIHVRFLGIATLIRQALRNVWLCFAYPLVHYSSFQTLSFSIWDLFFFLSSEPLICIISRLLWLQFSNGQILNKWKWVLDPKSDAI